MQFIPSDPFHRRVCVCTTAVISRQVVRDDSTTDQRAAPVPASFSSSSSSSSSSFGRIGKVELAQLAISSYLDHGRKERRSREGGGGSSFPRRKFRNFSKLLPRAEIDATDKPLSGESKGRDLVGKQARRSFRSDYGFTEKVIHLTRRTT